MSELVIGLLVVHLLLCKQYGIGIAELMTTEIFLGMDVLSFSSLHWVTIVEIKHFPNIADSWK